MGNLQDPISQLHVYLVDLEYKGRAFSVPSQPEIVLGSLYEMSQWCFPLKAAQQKTVQDKNGEIILSLLHQQEPWQSHSLGDGIAILSLYPMEDARLAIPHFLLLLNVNQVPPLLILWLSPECSARRLFLNRNRFKETSLIDFPLLPPSLARLLIAKSIKPKRNFLSSGGCFHAVDGGFAITQFGGCLRGCCCMTVGDLFSPCKWEGILKVNWHEIRLLLSINPHVVGRSG